MDEKIAFGVVIGVVFVTLIVLFCAIIIKLYIQKVKNYTRIIYQKDIDFQKAINNTIIETQEQVLNNVSQDLHDDAGQQLTYINFQLENLKLDSDELNNSLSPVTQSVAQLAKTIRSISHALNNQLLSQQNLIKAIETEVDRIKENGKIKIQFQTIDRIEKDFSTNEKIVIYRIFQETINNVLKHSKAKTVAITIKANPFFEMTITDDGKGFDFENIKNKSLTLGLQNMIDRAAIINYKMEIKSEIDKGTTVLISENKQ